MAALVVQQAHIRTPSTAWNSGICDCFQDMDSCCYAYWCCPCFACSTTGKFGESTCLPLVDILGPGLMAAFGMAFCVPPVTLGMRVAVRHKYNIGGSICEDIMVSCCCIWCSWCQMSREIKARNETITFVATQPLIHQIPVATTQVVTTQQVVGFAAAPVAVAPAVQMAPITVVQ